MSLDGSDHSCVGVVAATKAAVATTMASVCVAISASRVINAAVTNAIWHGERRDLHCLFYCVTFDHNP